MSDTNNKSKRAASYIDMKLDENEKGIVIDQGNYSPSRKEVNELPGMEIPFGKECECTVTNETPDGRTAMIDKKTGNVIGYLDSDGTINRKLAEQDRNIRNEDKEH